MMDNLVFDYISSSAVSLVVSGNTGISPFLTLFVLGLVEMGQPELLNMGDTAEAALASWWSIGLLGLLSLGEVVGKCIPAIDEMIDSAEVFVVPFVSILASLATMGLLPVPAGSNDDAGQGQTLDVMGMLGDRALQEGDVAPAATGDEGFGEGFLTFTKVCLVLMGVGLSLSIHFFKMLLRLSSLACSGGCCQPCITVAESLSVVIGVALSILAPAFAIVACVVLLVAAGYVLHVKCCKRKEDEDEAKDGKPKGPAAGTGADVENQRTETSEETTAGTAAGAEEIVEAVVVLPSPVPSPVAPNTVTPTGKPDVTATVY